LLVFDCDGVLVDSEAIADDVGAAWITSLGWPMPPEEARARFLGLSDVAMFALIEARIGRTISVEEIADNQREFAARLAAELQPVPGVRAVIEAVAAAGWASAVASSGGHAKMKTNLTKVGFYDHFKGRIFSAEDVANGKPAPDVYLLACKTMGHDPATAFAIEDSPNGVRAAVAAGLTVIGFARETRREDLLAAGAHHVVDDMAEVTAALGL
jgi:HAD superfamily hydrolase (TIGR01509 family)